ncbi:MAG: hypothetical protein ABFD75_06665 [Smithella sp.]
MSRFELLEFTNEKGEKDFIILDRLIKTEQPKARWLEGINDAFKEKFDNGDLGFKVIV